MTFISRSVEFQLSERDATTDGRTLEGYAAVFGQDTEINSWEGRYTERVAPGAFKKTLRESKRLPVMQWNHGRDAIGAVPIGVYDEVREDGQGLYVHGRLFDNHAVEPIRQAIEAQAINGMSIAFRVTRDEWRDKNNKLIRGDELDRLLYEPGDRAPLTRTVKELQLSECGPVLYPAYAGTSVGVRTEDREALLIEYRRTMADSAPEELPAPIAEETASVDAERSLTSTPRTPEITSKPERRVMKTLAELQARAVEIVERLTEIGTEHRDAELPTEVRTEWDALKTEKVEIAASIADIEARAEEIRSLGAAGRVDAPVIKRGTAVHVKKDVFDLDEIRMSSRTEEEYTARVKDNALRAVESARFGRGVTREAAQDRVADLLTEVDTHGELSKRILATGSAVYERAFFKAAQAGTMAVLNAEEHRALSLGTDANGGYAVPFQLDPTVMLTNNGALNPLREISRKVNITGKEWQGITSAGVTVTRSAEASAASDNSPTLGQVTVRTKRVTGFIPFSYELDQDWGSMRGEMTALLADAKMREEATSFTLGDGTGNNANGVVATLTGNTVATAAPAASFVAADVYSLENASAPRFRGNAHMLANKTIINKIRQFDTTNGNALWERIGAGAPPQLLGYPIHECSDMVGTTTTGSKIMMFGDFQNFLIVDRVGMSVELIPTLFDQATARPTGQRGLFALWRNNSKILVDAAFKLLVVG